MSGDTSELICACGVRHHFAFPRWARRCPHCGAALAAAEPEDDEPPSETDAAAFADLPATHVVTPQRAARPAADPRDQSGRELDHFRLLRPLGAGGMGQVYEAYDSALDRLVAVKLLRPDERDDLELVSRFYSEARATARVSHPNVVAIYHVGCADEQPYFAMERLDGGSLERHRAVGAATTVRDGERPATATPEEAQPVGRPWPEALELAIQAARGLEAAHACGVIHRDVKPGNLLLDARGQLKLVDFGLAKTLDVELTRTAPGMILGTPAYMAPEQARGEEVDFRADIYALGVTLVQLIRGRPLFDDRSPLEVVSAHLSESPEPVLRELDAGPALIRLLEQMLAKRPEQRPASYPQLIAALEAARPRELVLAGFWTRGWAVTLDALLLFGIYLVVTVGGIVLGLLERVTPEALFDVDSAQLELTFGLVAIAYLTPFHALLGATPGKWLQGLEVVDRHGDPIGWGAALLRAVALVAMGTSLDLVLTGRELVGDVWPFGMLAINIACVLACGRAVHDWLAGTIVRHHPESGLARARSAAGLG